MRRERAVPSLPRLPLQLVDVRRVEILVALGDDDDIGPWTARKQHVHDETRVCLIALDLDVPFDHVQQRATGARRRRRRGCGRWGGRCRSTR